MGWQQMDLPLGYFKEGVAYVCLASGHWIEKAHFDLLDPKPSIIAQGVYHKVQANLE